MIYVIELHWEDKIDDGDFISIAKKNYDVLSAIDRIFEEGY